MTPLEMIRANAQLAVQQFQPLTDFEFGFDARSVQWVDAFIERQRVRPELSPEVVNGMCNVLGSWLGEAIIATHGGEWREVSEMWAVAYDEQNAFFPFNKVYKQFENGADDSIYAFYYTIGALVAQSFKVSVIDPE